MLAFWIIPEINGALTNTKMVYEAECADHEHSIDECPTKLYVYATKYKVAFDTQKVVSDNLFMLDSKQRECKVFDRKNWRCEDKDGLGGWESIVDGDYSYSTHSYVTKGSLVQRVPDLNMPLRREISSIRYYYNYIANMF